MKMPRQRSQATHTTLANPELLGNHTESQQLPRELHGNNVPYSEIHAPGSALSIGNSRALKRTSMGTRRERRRNSIPSSSSHQWALFSHHDCRCCFSKPSATAAVAVHRYPIESGEPIRSTPSHAILITSYPLLHTFFARFGGLRDHL